MAITQSEVRIYKDQLNHQAYDDVLSNEGPSMPHNEYYMECYRSWKALVPDEDEYYTY